MIKNVNYFMYLIIFICKSYSKHNIKYQTEYCENKSNKDNYSLISDVPCDSLDHHWIKCEDVAQLKPSNLTNTSYCAYFGTSKGPLLNINITCTVLPCIECSGARSFKRTAPCIKFHKDYNNLKFKKTIYRYTMHYYLTALLYSIFLGILAVDRFYLGYSAIAVGKLMTLGGFGFWWIVDVILLVTNNLTPADDSQWHPVN